MLLLPTVVMEHGNGRFAAGVTLAARMRDGPFKSLEIALEAGQVALREFLELLEFGQENDA